MRRSTHLGHLVGLHLAEQRRVRPRISGVGSGDGERRRQRSAECGGLQSLVDLQIHGDPRAVHLNAAERRARANRREGDRLQ